MPERGKIFSVEDDPDVQKVLKILLEDVGYEIVDIATSFSEAMAKIPELTKNGVDIALVDGNLTPRQTDGSEGETIAWEIKQSHPQIIIIGHAGVGLLLPSADFNCPKTKGIKCLIETLKNS
jgi:CheY-like chemotaxis protein